ncbi:Leucine-rich repeat and immunoglobulin domain containing-NOGO receptor-interacting protein [Apis cerana cerana]|uniref:Leucine-rich repeat and immunoglobulin domain containing-NOGO receptor-interacting protein n=1 Tax=Apis cerana cerana TaxID=94128 RepID=A0A2A3EK93_APICC|nr:Leucine-rich repeat and immunoglobulin domain containing-NOGO receptor-interacting protein [Apis cerana cerana]
MTLANGQCSADYAETTCIFHVSTKSKISQYAITKSTLSEIIRNIIFDRREFRLSKRLHEGINLVCAPFGNKEGNDGYGKLGHPISNELSLLVRFKPNGRQFQRRRSSYGMASRGPSATTTVAIAIAMAVAMSVMSQASGLCPTQCRCDDESLRASCAYAGLEVVPIQLNPEITHLDLSNNRVANIHLSFSFYGNLEALDLTSNAIHTLGSDNFVFQKNLATLNVSGNAIRNLTKNSLQGLASLRELNLAGNNISDMDEQAFKTTSELETLNLSDNSITSLPEGLLKNLHKIRALILKGNSLLEIPTENLALAPSLENVDLSDNLIQELDRDSLPSLPSLVSLDLANNVIRNIGDDAFDRLPDLLRLDLSGNNLTSVPTPALARLNVLSNLILSRNPLAMLDAAGFRNLYELRSLELNDCTIISVHARAFADNVNLERISLDGNRGLKELPARVLYSARYLKWVSLRRCSLSTLQPTQFPVDGLSSLRVGGNPLVCNCSVHWLWNVIRAEERRNESRLELDTHDIICTDEEFAGKALRLAYAAPNRPEFLVYVGRSNDELDKSAESYSRRLLARGNEDGSSPYDSPGGRKVGAQDANVYETPRYARPSRRDKSSETFTRPGQTEEGVYAVADVTDLHGDEPVEEVLSLYRMQNVPPTPPTSNLHRNLDYAYDYDYDYEPPVPHKPHVVFFGKMLRFEYEIKREKKKRKIYLMHQQERANEKVLQKYLINPDLSDYQKEKNF